jgi:DNA polymerase-3 subunit delta
MTPEQFQAQVRRQNPQPAYLFLGPEPYHRAACREALLERALTSEEREHGFIRHSLDEVTLAEVIDDARSFSLFAPRRVIWAARAEAVLPKGRAAAAEEADQDGKASPKDAQVLADYLKDPTPDVVLVFDSSRFEFDGDDKTKIERLRKFFAAIASVVEFPRPSAEQARRLAQTLAREAGLQIGPEELDLLVEASGSSAAALANEIEKLRLFAGTGRRITAADIAQLAPHAGAGTIFALVAAMGRNDRPAALEILDTLVREGEYLPLALAFLATQFRQALVAKELNLRSSGQILAHFSRSGVAMWPARAQQILETTSTFSAVQLSSALSKIAAADRNLRDARPDDRTILEDFLVSLTLP